MKRTVTTPQKIATGVIAVLGIIGGFAVPPIETDVTGRRGKAAKEALLWAQSEGVIINDCFKADEDVVRKSEGKVQLGQLLFYVRQNNVTPDVPKDLSISIDYFLESDVLQNILSGLGQDIEDLPTRYCRIWDKQISEVAK